jgi:lysophospholipase L1-like esterase
VTASFLALGDSYTIGEGVREGEGWPALLAVRLRSLGVPIADPRIIARTGWTTTELLAAVDAAGASGSQDLVTLMAGVNDQYRGLGVRPFKDAWTPLLARALELSKLPARLVVLSIPDWSVTPFAEGRDRVGIARDIDQYNDISRVTALEAGASFVDVTTMSRLAANDPSLLGADKLHPSAAMYSMWVEHLVPIARRLVAPR